MGLRPALPHRQAFSLVELLLVVAIIGVYASIAMPRMSNSIERSQSEVAARRVMADIAFARNRALTRNRPQRITFSTTGYEIAGTTAPAETYAVNLTRESTSAGLSSPNFGGDAILIFDAYGRSDSGGSVVVGSGSRRRTVNISATTGEVTLQ